MAKITKPQDQVIGTGGQISLDDASRVGRSQAQMGAQVASAGEQYFQEAKRAVDLAAYSNAMAGASEEYALASQERLKKSVDKDGNPTYESLPGDIENMGTDIMNKHLGKLASPEAASQFRNNFGNFVQGQKMKAYGTASQQALEYSRGSIFNNLEALKENSLVNPEMAADNVAQVRQLLDDSVVAGSMTQAEADEKFESYRSTVNPELFKQQIMQDPQSMKKLLEDSEPAALGLNYAESEKLMAFADKVTEAQQKQEDAIAKAERQQLDAKVDVRVSEFEAMMAKDLRDGTITVSEALIEADATLDHDPKKKNQLLEKLFKHEAKAMKKAETVNGVNSAIQGGESLAGFTPAQMNDWYSSAINNFAQSQGMEAKDVPMSIQIGLASKAKGRSIPLFEKRISESLKAGEEANALETVQGLKTLESINPEAINNMDARTKAIYHMASSKIFDGNRDPATALAEARDAALRVDDPATVELTKKFEAEEDFKYDEMEDLVDSAFDEFSTGFFDAEQAAGVQNLYRQKLKEAYVLMNGDKDAAIDYANRELSGVMGETTFNNGNHIMMHSPDKMFSQYDQEVLHDNLGDYLEFVYEGELSEGDITIRSDRHTRGLFIDGEETISYGIFDSEGRPIINPNTGKPDRWAVTESGLRATEKVKSDVELIREIAERERGEVLESFQPHRGASRMGARAMTADTDYGRAINKATIRQSGPYYEVLISGQETLEKHGINTPERLRHFLAQMGHESASFTASEERPSKHSGNNFQNYDPGTRVGRILGNTQPGDGARFKGRGLIQLTGRDNYRRYGKMIGVDLENNPELAAEPEVALAIAAAYWESKGLNELADSGNIKQITKRINGGYNGYKDRVRRYDALDFLGE